MCDRSQRFSMSTFDSSAYEGWDAIPESTQLIIKNDHDAREAAEAQLLLLQEEKTAEQAAAASTAATREQEQWEADSRQQSRIPDTHGAGTRAHSRAATAPEEPRRASGGHDFAHHLMQALSHSAGTGMDVSALSSIKPWDGREVMGEDELTKFQAFKSVFMATCGQMGLLSLLEQSTPVKVGVPDHDRVSLEVEHGAETVRKAYQLWSMLLQKIPYAPIAHAILAAGIPQVGWRSFASTILSAQTQKSNVSRAIGTVFLRGRMKPQGCSLRGHLCY